MSISYYSQRSVCFSIKIYNSYAMWSEIWITFVYRSIIHLCTSFVCGAVCFVFGRVFSLIDLAAPAGQNDDDIFLFAYGWKIKFSTLFLLAESKNTDISEMTEKSIIRNTCNKDKNDNNDYFWPNADMNKHW